MSVYVGIDVHRTRSQVAVITGDGKVQLNRNVVNGQGAEPGHHDDGHATSLDSSQGMPPLADGSLRGAECPIPARQGWSFRVRGDGRRPGRPGACMSPVSLTAASCAGRRGGLR
jgi:hypothetical protein